jgi:hypothetical protein
LERRICKPRVWEGKKRGKEQWCGGVVVVVVMGER